MNVRDVYANARWNHLDSRLRKATQYVDSFDLPPNPTLELENRVVEMEEECEGAWSAWRRGRDRRLGRLVYRLESVISSVRLLMSEGPLYPEPEGTEEDEAGYDSQ